MDGKFRSQSAMEYLMTYGWAILIIAVVLGAIYSLGLFNGASLAPRASAGACQIFRPNGPLSVTYISLQGACTNELPQYVAKFSGPAGSLINTASTGLPAGSNAGSFFAWIYFTGGSGDYVLDSYGTTTSGNMREFRIDGNVLEFSGFSSFGATSTLTVIPNVWHFVGYTYSAGATTITFYMDGTPQVKSGGASPLNTVISYSCLSSEGVGCPGNSGLAFPGLASNVQIYNTTLDTNSIQALYQEGIGGAPINLQSLVAWWPLNGNTNDYSGNINNGQSTNVIYTNQWLSGYNIP